MCDSPRNIVKDTYAAISGLEMLLGCLATHLNFLQGRFQNVPQGCFWGPEHYFNKKFQGSIVKSAVGYTGGKRPAPSYQQVCTGSTGHAEAIQLDFDSSKTSYPDLVRERPA